MHYTRDDVWTHSDGYGESLPAVNVKVYSGIQSAWEEFVKQDRPDERFTLDWIEENVSERALDEHFWSACEFEFEYYVAYATEDEDAIFPASKYGKLDIYREGRCGGWAVVKGLPDVEDWDAILLARWRKFERIGREIAAGIPHQMLSSLYINEFEVWADEQADASVSNAEVPVDICTY